MHIVWFKCGYCQKFFQFPKDLIAHKKTVHGEQFRRDRLQRQREKEIEKKLLQNEKNSSSFHEIQEPPPPPSDVSLIKPEPQNEPPSSTKIDKIPTEPGESKNGIIKNGASSTSPSSSSWTLRSCEPPILVSPEKLISPPRPKGKMTIIKMMKHEILPSSRSSSKNLIEVAQNLKLNLSGVDSENKNEVESSPRKKRLRKTVGHFQIPSNGRSLTPREKNRLRNRRRKIRSGLLTPRTSTRQYQCRVCKIFCKTKNNLYDHNARGCCENGGKSKYKCRYCTIRFHWTSQRLRHEKKFHADNFKAPSVQRQSPDGRRRRRRRPSNSEKIIRAERPKRLVTIDEVKKTDKSTSRSSKKNLRLVRVNPKRKLGSVFQRNFQLGMANKACPYISRGSKSRDGKFYVNYSCNFCQKTFPRPSTAVIHTWNHTGKILDYTRLTRRTNFKNDDPQKGVEVKDDELSMTRFTCKFKDCRYFTMKEEKKLALHYTYTHGAPFVLLQSVSLVFNASIL